MTEWKWPIVVAFAAMCAAIAASEWSANQRSAEQVCADQRGWGQSDFCQQFKVQKP